MKKDLILYEDPKSLVSESIRLLKTNLTYKMKQKTRESNTFLIASSSIGEGKSWLTSNLAISFAQSKQKVLIVDTDLRRGRQHEIFNNSNQDGLSDLLSATNIRLYNKEFILSNISTTDIPNLYLLPSGKTSQNSSELLENKNFDIILNSIKKMFDIIIFDAPPISIVTDSLLLCNKVDHVLIVSAINKTKKSMLLDTKKKIEAMGGNIIGVVINKMPYERIKEYTKAYSNYNDKRNYSDKFNKAKNYK